MKVLLAEDNESHRELLEILIRSGEEESRITAVGTGSEFIEQMVGSEYDVALLDYHLPDSNAAELLPKIDEIPNRPPVVIISSDSTSDTIISSLRSGGRDFLPKEEAFNPVELVQRLRVAVQRRQVERRLIQQQKDECISSLAGGLAHDFNNMLVGILGKAALLRDSQLDPNKHHEYCNGIMLAAESMADLSKQLLAYARGGKYHPTNLNCNEVIEDTLAMLSGTIAKQIKLRSFLSRDMWNVEADRSQLVQALLNLCLNGCEAMGGKGTLSVFTENMSKRQSWTDDFLVQHPPGEYVHIVVSDTGCGIPVEQRSNVFEPYFSTKGDGRGLGLAAVKGIIATHGGGIVFESPESGGTAFHIFLPRLRAETAKEIKNESQPSSELANVLVIEDEPEVREVIGEILEIHNHQVSFAEDGASARRLLEEDGTNFDVVLLDMRLPDCNGKELLQLIKSHWPDLKVILCSGYERASVLEDLLLSYAEVPFLAKPFRPEDLLRLIDSQLSDIPPRESVNRD